MEKLIRHRSADILWSAVGPMVRMAGRTAAGRIFLESVGYLSGAALAESGMFGIEKTVDPADVRREWAKILDAVGCAYELGPADAAAAELFVLDCPARLSVNEGRAVCLAGMSADRELVRRLGGELHIGDTIAGGAEKCRLTVRRPAAGGGK